MQEHPSHAPTLAARVAFLVEVLRTLPDLGRVLEEAHRRSVEFMKTPLVVEWIIFALVLAAWWLDRSRDAASGTNRRAAARSAS